MLNLGKSVWLGLGRIVITIRVIRLQFGFELRFGVRFVYS